MREHKPLLYGVHFLALGFFLFLLQVFGSALGVFSLAFFRPEPVLKLADIFFIAGAALALLDLAMSAVNSGERKSLIFSPVTDPKVSVGMTAYNDELAIGAAAGDFLSQEHVVSVVVVDNNSIDGTTKAGLAAGAKVIGETVQGYGACCVRALREAMKAGDVICLVEGDCTFSGSDLKKLLSYLENADMVLGTRTTKELNTPDSQLNSYILLGNVLMAKLLQLRFMTVRLTDLGCTFRVIRKPALERIIDRLEVTGNHFSCEMILTALKNRLMVIEIPVTLKKRVGESKGVGGNFFKAAVTAMHMWRLIMFK
ncbi:MAG: glycosyltransferase [Elusimicrobiales bacterium]|jgi:hypothetical protein